MNESEADTSPLKGPDKEGMEDVQQAMDETEEFVDEISDLVDHLDGEGEIETQQLLALIARHLIEISAGVKQAVEDLSRIRGSLENQNLRIAETKSKARLERLSAEERRDHLRTLISLKEGGGYSSGMLPEED